MADIKTLGVELEYESLEEDGSEYSCGHSGDEFCYECYNRCNSECQHFATRSTCPSYDSQLLQCRRCQHEHDRDCYEDDCVAPPTVSRYNSWDFLNSAVDTKPVPNDWCIKDDGSLSHGFELNTPILHLSDWSMQNLHTLFSRVLQKLLPYATVESTCSVHVHVGRPRFDYYNSVDMRQWERNLVLSFANNEDILYQLAAGDTDGHRGRRYCAPPYDDQLLTAAYGRPGYSDVKPADSTRYQAINLCSRYDTVEYRLFNGTLNPEVLMAYISLSLSLSRSALGHKALPPCATAKELLKRLKVPKEEWPYYMSYYDLTNDRHRQGARRQANIRRARRHGPAGVIAVHKLNVGGRAKCVVL